METIKNYIETMFSTLPKTSEIEKLKNELLCNMEDKYNDLKALGKTENEAIGTVISEFGNIDELIKELDISIEEPNYTNENNELNDISILSKNDVINFLKEKKKLFSFIAIGVSLCIIGVALSGLLNSYNSVSETMSVIPLFILLVPAITLFIYSGNKLEKYKFIKNGDFKISTETKAYISEEYNKSKKAATKGIIIGVCLCVISPLFVIIGESMGNTASTWGVFLLLIIISIAVFIFINVAAPLQGYKMILKIEDYSKRSRENDKVLGAVASVVWPLAVCVFLLTGFVFNLWNMAWIIFPITGILFGAFAGAYKSLKGNR